MPQIMMSCTQDEHAKLTAEARSKGISASNLLRIAKGLPPLERHVLTEAERLAGMEASPTVGRIRGR